jgi:iron complex outermembrane receptor protein
MHPNPLHPGAGRRSLLQRRLAPSSLTALPLALVFAFGSLPRPTALPVPPIAKPLPEVVVTADRTSREIFSIPASITLLDASEISQAPGLTLPDLLRSQTGIQITDNLGNGRTTQVDLRGFGETASNNTLVLIDGRRINSSDIAEVDWTTLSLENIERVEILRGGASVLYGDKAVGGVLNILTRRPSETLSLSSQTAFGSFNAFSQSASLSGATGPLRFRINGSYADSDGYRTNNRFRNKTYGLSLGLQPTPTVSLDLQFGGKEDRYGMPSYTKRGENPRFSRTPLDFAETLGQYLRLAPKLTLTPESQLQIPLQFTETEYRSVFKSFDYSARSRVREWSLQPNWDSLFEVGRLEHRLKLGVDHTRTERTPLNDPWRSGEIRRDETGFYLNDSITLIPQKLFADLGYRFTRVAFDYDSGPENRSFPIHSTRAGLTYRYATESKLFVSVDRSFRNMLLTGELFNSPILPPQTSWQTQLGVQHALNSKTSASLTAFRIDTQNELFYDPFLWTNSNYPKTRRVGLEASLTSDPVPSLHLFSNFRLIDARMLEGVYNQREIPLVARYSAQAGFRWSPFAPLQWDTRLRWFNHQYAISDWRNQRRDWSGNDFLVADTRLTYSPLSWLKLYAGINNLFNRHYAESGTFSAPLGDVVLYPNPALNWTAGVSVTREF